MSARELPAAIEAERAVLGAVLLEVSCWNAASELQSDDFFLPAHRAAWDAIRSMEAQRVPADPLLVWDRIAANGDAAKFEGGMSYFAALPGASWNVAHYVERVRDAAIRRRLIAALAEATSRAYDTEVETPLALAEVRTALDKLAGAGGDVTRFSDISQGVLDAIGARGAGDVTGARTGIQSLDKATGGFQPGWLVIIAAETGGGKTALAMQTAIDVVLNGGTALACNLEMTKEELAERAMVYLGRLNSQLVRLGEMQPDMWARAHSAQGRLGATNFYLDDAATSVPIISARARRWRARHQDLPGLLIVDFVQLIRSAREKGTTRAQEIGTFAQDLKALAKELRVPVILVSQLNRAAVKGGEQPSKSDLKESGDLENAADLILLPWNKEGTGDGMVKIIADKFRHGQTATFDAHWIGRHFRFANPDDGGYG